MSPRNELFHSLAVFCFTIKAELAGERQKAWVCRVVDHEKPTTENWKDYFVGFSSLKEYAWQALEPEQKIDVLSAPALAGSEEMPLLTSGDELHVQSTATPEAIANSSLFPATMPAPVTVESRYVVRADIKEAGDPDVPF